MKRLIALPVLVASIAAIALGAASTADAHSTSWHWAPKTAVNTLFDDGIAWQDGHDWMDYAKCRGRGNSIRLGGGRLGFKHFTCHIESHDGEAYVVNFHVTGKFSYLVRFVRYE
jgi:hypothetical protein